MAKGLRKQRNNRANKSLQFPTLFIFINAYIKSLSKRESGKINMKTTKVDGKNNTHRVLMYAISTCAWCKKTKKFLKDNGVEYEFIDVDLCSEEDRDKIRQDILRRGGNLSYPTLIVDDKKLITGYDEAEIKVALGI